MPTIYVWPIEFTPAGYRLFAEASERLRNAVYQVKGIEHVEWEAALSERLYSYFVSGRVFANIAPDGRSIMRISPRSWRQLHDRSFSLLLSSPFHNIEGFPASNLLVTDHDFQIIESLRKIIPRDRGQAVPTTRNSPEARIIELAADIIRRDPMKPKAEVRAELLGSGLSVSKNSWERDLYSRSRVAADQDPKSAPGRRKRVEQSGGD